ncbi:hypothetical protein OPV22_026527 [Ensete ventricosum]|uniref:Protein TIFY n=1 Tax=Ensete ventricosum TaxID=4639 RepID=A0AAV8Q6S5_ENSVE|nr:hypothetical protein OPV22_026527 [Ensete ventricosum]
MAEKMGKRGVKAGEKSQFSITCSLLNQYLKKKGSLGTIGLDMSPWPLGHQPTDKHRAPTTLSLLPGVSVSAEDHTDHGADQHAPKPAVPPAMEESASDKEMEKAQLTIFYGGKVLVFDHFPVDKAKDVSATAAARPAKAHPGYAHSQKELSSSVPGEEEGSDQHRGTISSPPSPPSIAGCGEARRKPFLGRRAPKQEHSSESSR